VSGADGQPRLRKFFRLPISREGWRDPYLSTVANLQPATLWAGAAPPDPLNRASPLSFLLYSGIIAMSNGRPSSGATPVREDACPGV
jgi:hypothetical protein